MPSDRSICWHSVASLAASNLAQIARIEFARLTSSRCGGVVQALGGLQPPPGRPRGRAQAAGSPPPARRPRSLEDSLAPRPESRTGPERGGSPPCGDCGMARSNGADQSNSSSVSTTVHAEAPFGADRNADAAKGAHRPGRCATRPRSTAQPDHHGCDAVIGMTILAAFRRRTRSSLQVRASRSSRGRFTCVRRRRCGKRRSRCRGTASALLVGGPGDRPVDHVDPRAVAVGLLRNRPVAAEQHARKPKRSIA